MNTLTNFVSNPPVTTRPRRTTPAFVTNYITNFTTEEPPDVLSTNPVFSLNASLYVSASNSSQILQSLTFSNSNDISFGLDNGVITASYSNTGGGGGGVAISAGTQSVQTGT